MNNYSKEITYEEVKDLDKTKLSRLSTEKILSACLREFKDGQETDVLEFLFGTYVECINLLELDDRIFKKIFPKIDDYANMVLYNLYNSSEAIETNVLANGSKLLEILANLLNYIKQFLGEFHLFEMNTLQEEILNLLTLFYQYSKTILDKEITKSSEFLLEFRIFFRNCQRLQNTIVSILVADNIKFFDEREIINEFKLFVDLLYRLVNVAGKITKLDVKASAELWKCITKLVHNYSDNLKSKNYSLPNTFDWLDNSVKYLTEEIERNITSIENLPPEQLNRNFKINSFYINVILKFSYYFSSEFFYGSKYILNTIMFCLRLEKCANEKLAHSINQHSTVGLLNVLFEIYKNSRFIGELHNLSKTTANHNEYIELCLILIKRIIKEHKIDTINLYFSNSDKNMLSDLFDSIPKSDRIVIDNKFYHKIIGYISNLILGCVENRIVFRRFEIILVQLLTKNDSFIVGTLAIDLWTVVLGNFLQETLYFYFKFWNSFYFRWNSRAAYPAKSFVKILLKNIYHSLRPKFRLQFYNENIQERCKIWSVLGMDKIPNSNEQSMYLDEVYCEINAKMEKFLEEDLTVREYDEMLNHLQLLTSHTKILKPNDQYHNNLNLLLRNIKNLSDINKFSPFVILLLKSFLIYRNYIDSRTVISEIKEFYNVNLLLSLKLQIVFYLEQLNIRNNLKDIFLNETDITIESLINKNNIVNNCSINSLIKLHPVTFEHFCVYTDSNPFNYDHNTINSYEKSPKRIKLSVQTDTNIDIDKELKQFEDCIDSITCYSKSGRLNLNNLAAFSKILDKANNIVNNFNNFENSC